MQPREPRTSLMQHSLFIFHEEAAASDVLKETLSYLSAKELFKLRNINKHTHKIALNIIFERRGATACLYQANIMKSWFNIDAINKDSLSLARINELFNNKLFTILSNCFLDPDGDGNHKKICCEIMAIFLWNANNPILKDPVIGKVFMDLFQPPSNYYPQRERLPTRRALFLDNDVLRGIQPSIYVPVDEMFLLLLIDSVERLEDSILRKKENTKLLKEIFSLLGRVNDEQIIHHYLCRLIDCVPLKLGNILSNVRNNDTRSILDSFNSLLRKIKDRQLIEGIVTSGISRINALQPNTAATIINNSISLVVSMAKIIKDENLVANLATCLVKMAEAHSSASVLLYANAMMREVARHHTSFPSFPILEHLFNFIKVAAQSASLNQRVMDDIHLVLKLAIEVDSCHLKNEICDFLFGLIKDESYLSAMKNGSHVFSMADYLKVNTYLFDFIKLAAQHQEYNIRKTIFDYFTNEHQVECDAGNLFPLFFSIYNKGNSELLTLFLSRVMSEGNFLLPKKPEALFHLLDLCVDLPDRLKLLQFIFKLRLPFMQRFSHASLAYVLDPLLISAFAKIPEAPLGLITEVISNSPDANLIYLYRFLQNANKDVFELKNHLPAIESLRLALTDLIVSDYHSRQDDIAFSLPYHFQHLPEECFSSIFLEEWYDTILRVSHGNPPKDVPRYWLGRLEKDDAIAEMYEQVTGISDELKNKLFLIANFYLPEAECHRLIVESCSHIKVQQISDQTNESYINAFFQRFRFQLLDRGTLMSLDVSLDAAEEPPRKRFKPG